MLSNSPISAVPISAVLPAPTGGGPTNAVWTAGGTSSASWVGASLFASVLSASGVGSASFFSAAGNIWQAGGQASASFIGQSTAASTFSAAGSASALWSGVASGVFQAGWAASDNVLIILPQPNQVDH